MRYLYLILLLAAFAFSKDGKAQIITTVAGNGTNGYSGDGGSATTASIMGSQDVAIDAIGNIYIPDGSNRVRKVDTAGVITTIAGTGTPGFSGDGGPATAANLGDVRFIALDTRGNIYITEYYYAGVGHHIRKIDTSGIITTYAGNGGSGTSGDGGPATAASVGQPTGLICDNRGNLYFSQLVFGFRCWVRKVDSFGIITTVAGNGGSGYSGDGGPATAATLDWVWDVAVDRNGNIYICERMLKTIRKIDTSGIISLFAGTPYASGYTGDGRQATATTLTQSCAVACDSVGNVYFSDHARIRKINTSGVVTTYAGTGISGFSGDGGFSVAAKISYQCEGLCLDMPGNLYIADGSNYRIRKVTFNNIPPYFSNGSSQHDTICGNSTGDTLNAMLAVTDSNYGQKLILSLVDTPMHGSANVADTIYSTGGVTLPTGLYYLPDSGFVGIDTFSVLVTDGYAADTIVIYVTMQPATAPITGAAHVCMGSTTLLADMTAGGVWSSSDTVYASISTTGLVTGVYPGTAIISYSVLLACGISVATAVMTINPVPTTPALTGPASICAGASTAVYSPFTGGSWSSGSTGIASVGSSSGIVTGGGTAGVALITYTTAAGCAASVPVTVMASPAAITGILSACVGMTTTLANTVTGGVWSSSNTGIATVGSATGIVAGISIGPVTITYQVGSGCRATAVVNINPAPTTVTGVSGICPGDLSAMYNGVSGGTWISRDTAIAAVDSFSGMVTGVAGGSTYIIYTMGAGCADSMAMVINPAPAPITGPTRICIGTSATMTDATAGGAWSSAAPSIAMVGTSGVVTGMGIGTTTIYYSAGGCNASHGVTVNPAPAAIAGAGAICAGANTTLSNTVTGGVWTSGNPAVATINSSGVYTGVIAGTATISYSTGAGCTATLTVTIHPVPAAITGTLNVCPAMSTTLSSTTSGGTWTASGSAVTITGPGLVMGVSTGTSIISYTTGSSCRTTAIVTVNPLPAAISGIGRACPGSSSTLTTSPGGGIWSSAATGIATVGSLSGSVTGVIPGTVTMSYTLPTGCNSTKLVTINPLPAAITGPGTLCVGQSVTMTSSTTGGTWSKSNTNITISSTSGSVTGVNGGTSVVTYSLPTGCYVTTTITVNSSPGTITGTMQVCAGSSAGLTVTSSGSGAWSSGSTLIATIGSSTGIVSGVTAGTAAITYSAGAGCDATATVTVNPLPAAFTVTGGGGYCAGSAGLHVGLSGSATGVGYQLYRGASAIGSPEAGTGAALDFGFQTATGVYTVVATTAQGCTATMTGSTTIAVNPLPAPIGGPSAVCVGASITLTNSGGGSWLSSAPGTAIIGSTTGVVNGVAIGTTTITYTLSTTCVTTKTITVSTLPTAIIGPATVCAGASANLTVTPVGGVWSSSNVAVAAVGSLIGTITGVTTGTVTVSYSLCTGCSVTKTMTVLPSPAAITGIAQVCAAGSTSLTVTSGGGVWTSGSTGVATVSGTGVVSGGSAGTAIISYTAGGCSSTIVVTVNAVPVAITGPGAVCVSGTVTEANTVGGGIWSTTSATVTIGPTNGIVTGISVGTGIITYSLGTGITACSVTRTITVNAAPTISGASAVCVSGSAGLTMTPTMSGVWSSGATGIATVSSGGMVTGVSTGVAAITFTPATAGCIAIKTVTVNTTPGAITGTAQVCVGNSSALSVSSGSGGLWTSGSMGVATIGSLSGVVNGVAAGVATITYSLGTGCTVTKVVTVNPLPAPIVGGAIVCIGSTTSLSIPTTGGSWSSGAAGIATVSTTGLVTGATLGTATISYTLPTGCAATRIVTVNSLPGSISGASHVCLSATGTLTALPTGGIWSSSNASIVNIGSGTGIVVGVMTGSATITYSLGPGCEVTKSMTVDPLPAGITGSSSICIGATTTLSTASIGGTWSSGATGVATIAPSGMVTGVAGGSATISYTVASTGCSSTYGMTVITVPPITGLTNLCAWGDTVTIYNANPAGSYSSSLLTITNLGGGAGRITTYAPGTASITYTLTSGCALTMQVTVNTLPGLITGTTNLCAGSSSTLGNAVSGGTWSSGAVGVATIGSASGLLTGVSAGSTYIRYIIPNGCKVDTVVNVSTFPVAGTITGVSDLCVSTSASLSTIGGSGLWSSDAAGIAGVVAATGVVTGVSAGVATISYAVTNVCGTATATHALTVNPIPDAGVITGADSVCVSSVSTLSNIVGGGVWSCTNGNATVSSTGVVSGVTVGMDTVAYTVTSAEGCVGSTQFVVRVRPWGLCGALTSPRPSPQVERVTVWPNPAREELHVENAMGCEVRIYNMLGQEVMFFGKLRMTNKIEVLNIDSLTPGVYVVEVVGAMGERASRRLVVRR